ncbi:MAG: hypothetical protein OEL83_06620 [Desulforhopalus sp.]|nr:hypothetical protein [Desulforhopalus sp.]
MAEKRILIIYYSYTQQTKILLKKFIAGLESTGVTVSQERLEPVNPYEFPFRSNIRLAIAMVTTFFLKRMPIRPVTKECFGNWDCIILAGPTWSYHPCGPMLDFLDRYGQEVCQGKRVVPFISCRSYWQLHFWNVQRRLKACGAKVAEPIVFMHPGKEPWRFIGLLLQLRGKVVGRENSWFRRHYSGYGHSKQQGLEAMAKGKDLGEKLIGGWLG